MKVKITSEGELPDEVLNPPETPDEISNKISKMLPDMKSIQKTGLIKKTDSFKESKEILTNFKTALYHLSEEAINNPLCSYGITNHEVIQSVNKNAYELRSELLNLSVNIVNQKSNSKDLNLFINEVLNTANKLYKFIENKKSQDI